MAVEVEMGAYMFHPREILSHNPLHDLESLWWVGIWLLLCHYDSSNLEADSMQDHIQVVMNVSYALFSVNCSS